MAKQKPKRKVAKKGNLGQSATAVIPPRRIIQTLEEEVEDARALLRSLEKEDAELEAWRLSQAALLGGEVDKKRRTRRRTGAKKAQNPASSIQASESPEGTCETAEHEPAIVNWRRGVADTDGQRSSFPH
jgi:hypothetical protein